MRASAQSPASGFHQGSLVQVHTPCSSQGYQHENHTDHFIAFLTTNDGTRQWCHRRPIAGFRTARHIKQDYHIEETVRVPEPWRRALRVRPLPRNMSRENHSGCRQAPAKALQRHYGHQQHVYYVDVASPHHRGWYAAAVVHNTNTVNGSLSKPTAQHMHRRLPSLWPSLIPRRHTSLIREGLVGTMSWGGPPRLPGAYSNLAVYTLIQLRVA